MAKNDDDNDFIELLELLKNKKYRGMVKEMVFHPEKIVTVLEEESGQLLASAQDFLEKMAKHKGGHPIAFCWGETKSLCGKGTLACIGGTKPKPP
jgi:hypothetical protein